MSKRLLSILLILVMLCALSPAAVALTPLLSYEDFLQPYVERGATRGEVAAAIGELKNASVESPWEPINEIPDGAIRDIPRGAEYADDVYTLMRAGILVPTNKFNHFEPDRAITQAEMDGIALRLTYANARRIIKLTTEFAATDIFELTRDAVFTIQTFNQKNEVVRSASAFFISADGVAATCLHVFDGASFATATLADGSEHEISGVLAHSVTTNVALFQVEGSGFSWLPIADSDAIKTGATAYSLGAPLELGGTLSRGLVSYALRPDADRPMVQFSAKISFGSGGGALLDSQARVIGITSSSYTAGETLNLAEPSKHILGLKIGLRVSLREFKRDVNS